MASYFYICENSTLPRLRMELVVDGKYDFLKNRKFANAIQNADVTFSMYDESGMIRISDAECNIVPVAEDSCEEHFIIEYVWKSRDTKKKGTYKGQFKIKFMNDLYEEGVAYKEGTLIMPIYEDVYIMIK